MLIAHVTHRAPAEASQTEPKPATQIYRVEERGNLQEVVVQDGGLHEVRSSGWLWCLLALLPVGILTLWLLRRRGRARDGSAARHV